MRCVAVGCKTGRKSGIRIHSFPRDAKRRLEWAVKVNIAENGKLWVPPKDSNYGVCEAHFDEDQYEPRRPDRRLKPFAVPTLFNHRKAPKRRRKLVRDTTATGDDKPAGQQQHASREHLGGPSLRMAPPVLPGPSAFTVATSGGNVILVPTPPAPSQATAPSVAAGTPRRTPLGPLTPVQSQNIVLPPVNCLQPNGAPPIILVPVSAAPMPVILSVESLSSRAQSGVAGATPLLAKPPSFEQLAREADALRQKAEELRREQAETMRQALRLKASLARQSERLSRFLRLDQVEWLQREDGGPAALRWSEQTLRFALDLYCCSPEAYHRLLDNHYPLPAERALRTFCRRRGLREGVPSQLLQGDDDNKGSEGADKKSANIVWL